RRDPESDGAAARGWTRRARSRDTRQPESALVLVSGHRMTTLIVTALQQHLQFCPGADIFEFGGNDRRNQPKGNERTMGNTSELKVGDLAPDFALPDAQGNIVRLSDLRGKRVVVYFYPMDDTPGCTMQACGFRDAYPEIQERNAIVLGIS